MAMCSFSFCDFGFPALVICETHVAWVGDASLQEGFLLSPARTSGAETIWEPILILVSWLGIYLPLKPTWGHIYGHKSSGEIFFPQSSAWDRDASCCLPLWVDFFLVHWVLRENSPSRILAQCKNLGSIAPPCGYPMCHLHTSPFVTENGSDLQTNRNLSTCFSYFSLFWGFGCFPSVPERKKKSLLYFWAISWSLVNCRLEDISLVSLHLNENIKEFRVSLGER